MHSNFTITPILSTYSKNSATYLLHVKPLNSLSNHRKQEFLKRTTYR